MVGLKCINWFLYDLTITDQYWPVGLGYQLSGNWLAISWLSAIYRMTMSWLLAGYRLAINWLLTGYQLFISPPWGDYQLSMGWLLAGYGLAISSLPFDNRPAIPTPVCSEPAYLCNVWAVVKLKGTMYVCCCVCVPYLYRMGTFFRNRHFCLGVWLSGIIPDSIKILKLDKLLCLPTKTNK